MAEEIARTIDGYWLFINGKPTYINGWNYFYINYWHLDIGIPEYRSRDRKFFLFAEFCDLDPCSYGFTYPKYRREGATSKASCIHYLYITRRIKANGGIQSMTDDHAETVFQNHVVESWKDLPFFFRPVWEGSTSPKSKLSFKSPPRTLGYSGKTGRADIDLRSQITYREAGVKAYDTWKLAFYHHDEVGKSKVVDVYERWQVVKPCLSLGGGSKIVGLSIHTSTVGEMERGGGRNFHRICKASMYEKRNKNNQTISGLYNLFLPAYDGLEGFIDEFGESVIENPTPEQMKFLKTKTPALAPIYKMGIGAKLYLENKRAMLIEAGDIEAYNEEVRQFPIYFRECFRTQQADMGFDIIKIEERLEELQFAVPKKQCGNFMWVGHERKQVEWHPTPMGRFFNSMVLPKDKTNKYAYDFQLQSHIPLNTDFTAGADPFKFNKTQHRRKSDGGGAVFYRHTQAVDPPGTPLKEWKSHRFVCTYSNRVGDKEEYAEDMLKMCIYYGCPMFPEIDVPLIWDYFTQKGFGGFLIYKTTPDGRWDSRPGSTSSEKIKQDIFSEFMSYIKHHIHKEEHDELLLELKQIEGVEDMTNFDLFTAAGYALLGSKNVFEEVKDEENENDYINLLDFIQIRSQ